MQKLSGNNIQMKSVNSVLHSYMLEFHCSNWYDHVDYCDKTGWRGAMKKKRVLPDELTSWYNCMLPFSKFVILR
jgi:hypothetical protein